MKKIYSLLVCTFGAFSLVYAGETDYTKGLPFGLIPLIHCKGTPYGTVEDQKCGKVKISR